MLDELGSFLGIFLRQSAQVHRLLHDVEVFVERKGHIGVTVPLKVPVWKPQMVFLSMTCAAAVSNKMLLCSDGREYKTLNNLAPDDFSHLLFPPV